VSHWSNFVAERSEERSLSSRWQRFTAGCDLRRAAAGQLAGVPACWRTLPAPAPQQLLPHPCIPKPLGSCCSQPPPLVLQKILTAPVMYGPQAGAGGDKPPFHDENKSDRSSGGSQLTGVVPWALLSLLLVSSFSCSQIMS